MLVLANLAGGIFQVDFALPGSETQEALDLLDSHGFAERSGEQGQVVFEADAGVDSPEVRTAIESLFERIEADVSDVSVQSPYSEVGASQIAPDGKVAYAELNFGDRKSAQYADDAEAVKSLRDEVAVPGLRIELGGEIFVGQEGSPSEVIGVLLAIVILLVAFGSLLAAGLPIATALVGIGTGASIVMLLANVLDMPDFTVQAVLMVSIGVGIDYALFIVTRYREFLHQGSDPEHAVVSALDTAGRAVLFAGTTVVIALLGLLILNNDTFRGVAVGTTIGVLLTMLASVTLLPALLGFVGTNIDRFSLPHRKGKVDDARTSFWFRWSRLVQRRPWPPLLISLGLLLMLAAPVVSMRLGFGDAGNRPTSDTTRQAYDLLSDGFGPGSNGPLLLVAELPNGQSDLDSLTGLSETLRQTNGVRFASMPIPNEAGDAAIMQIIPATSPQDEATGTLVRNLRDQVVPEALAGTGLEPRIGGLSAAVEDFSDYTMRMLPVVMTLVLLLSFILLMAVFRSILVPLKAVIMNLLSVGAAYGLMVAVFQWGWGISLVGVGKEGPIEAWAPMMLFAVVFGLSMDYEVFLLSRIKEEYDRTGDNALAVADGVAATARVITAAAAIMVCVFGAFVLGPDRALKLFGFGMAAAVLIDATLVRMVLVPATMELLGDRNWWIPNWLDRILPAIHVEGSPDSVGRTGYQAEIVRGGSVAAD